MSPDAVSSPATTHPFVARFPVRDHHYIPAWFGYAVTQGAQTPEAVLEVVTRVVTRKLAWSMSPGTEALCRGVLLALTMYRGEALDYAGTLVQPRPPRREGGGG